MYIKKEVLIRTIAAFVTMIVIGNIYAWNILAAELRNVNFFTTLQTQIIFGSMIFTFCGTMIVLGMIGPAIMVRLLMTISAALLLIGYSLPAILQSSFISYLIGYSFMGGIGVGCMYLYAMQNTLSISVKKQGLITGIVVAGFAISSSIYSSLYFNFVKIGYSVSDVMLANGLIAATVLLLLSILEKKNSYLKATLKTVKSFWTEAKKHTDITYLFLGMLTGTFAGLLIIGNLRLIGQSFIVDSTSMIYAISLFSVANCCGRVFWGICSDRLGARNSIIVAQLFQAFILCLLLLKDVSSTLFVLISVLLGICFSSNFVLFANFLAKLCGNTSIRTLYPLVFLGYGLGAILGPIAFGIVVDVYTTAVPAYLIAIVISLIGTIPFIVKRNWAYDRCIN